MSKKERTIIHPEPGFGFVEGGESCEFFLNINGSSYITCERVDGRSFLLQLVVTGSNHVPDPVWVKGLLRHALVKAIIMKEKYLRILSS